MLWIFKGHSDNKVSVGSKAPQELIQVLHVAANGAKKLSTVYLTTLIVLICYLVVMRHRELSMLIY